MTTVPEPVDPEMEGEAAVRAVLEDRMAAMGSGDADRMLDLYAPEVVRFGLAPPLRVCGPGARDAAAVRSWLEGFEATPRYEVTDWTVRTTGDIAFSHSLNRMSATPRGSTEGFQLWYRETLCLRKLGDEWKIVHEHDSAPFHMDGSFRAAVDLNP